MNITAIPVVPLKLSQEAHYYANKFAAEQATAQKAKGVYLNTLAVCAVYSWVQWMEFTTAIDQGESWDPVIRRFNDVADLVLTDIGRLECRPLLPGERSILVPLEVREDRIGCVLVQFEQQLDKVKLLGFVPADASGNLPEKIAIDDLQSVEELTEYLEELDAPIFRKKFQESLSENLGKQTLIQQSEKLTPDEKLSLAAQLEAIALEVDPEVVLRSRRAKIQALRQEILELAAKYGADNLRIFHLSVSEGGVSDTEVNFLVNLKPGSGLLEQGGLLMDLRELLGFELYVFTEDDLKERYRELILNKAVPL